MAFCIYCGKELVDGECSCREFQMSKQQKVRRRKRSETSVETPSGNQNSDDSPHGYQNPEDGPHGYQNPDDSHRYQNPDEDPDKYSSEYEVQRERTPFFIPAFNPDLSSISSFISSVRDQTGVSEPDTNYRNPYEHNVPIVPDCIEPEDNEIIVKQYNLAKLRTRLKFMWAEGRLMVTNRRVLFRAAGKSLTGNILQEHQFNIDEIAGIEMHKDYKFSFLNFFGCLFLNTLVAVLPYYIFSELGNSRVAVTIAAILLGLLGLAFNMAVYKRFWLKSYCATISGICFYVLKMILQYDHRFFSGLFGFLTIVAAIIFLIDLIILCFVPNLVVKIKTKGGLGAITIGSQKAIFQRKTGDDYSGFAEIMPWEDTIMAINELGTMIDDLQKLGDYAVEKWAG